MCHWDRWYAEARALQEAVRDQGGAVSSPPPSNPADEGDDDDPLWSDFGSLADWDGSPSREHVCITSTSTDAAEEGSTDSPGCTEGEQRRGREISSPSVVNVAGDVTVPCDVVGDNDVVLRPPLHPFDSLSAPLSIGDCLALAQRQSQCVLAEGRAANGVHSRALPSPRDASGRVRLGYVSGDLMGTHPLTHLMQVCLVRRRLRDLPVWNNAYICFIMLERVFSSVSSALVYSQFVHHRLLTPKSHNSDAWRDGLGLESIGVSSVSPICDYNALGSIGR